MNMGMQLGQSQRLEQTISPQMLQSATILQKTSQELESAIVQEVESNPLLELDDEIPESLPETRDSENQGEDEYASGSSDDMAKEVEFESGSLEDSADMDYDILENTTNSDMERRLSDGTADTDAPFKDLNSAPVDPDELWDRPQKDRDQSLQDNLRNQLRDWNGTRELFKQLKQAGCSEQRFRDLVQYLIDSLDENGFLQSAPDEAMVKILSDNDKFVVEAERVIRGEIPLENASLPVAEAIHVLQTFKPLGIGARNLQECFLIQARACDNFPKVALEIVENHFEDLMALRYTKIAKSMARSTEEVQKAITSLSKFSPHPGRQISNAPLQIKNADMSVVEKKGRFEVECTKAASRITKRLHVNKLYADMLNDKGLDKDTREYISNSKRKAEEFISAVNGRFSTMEQVMRAIVKRQEAFFRGGPAFLKPMILQDIADEVGRDLSTISRVTNGKYVDTPFGIYELKQFFTSGVRKQATQAADISAADGGTQAAGEEIIGSAQILDAIKKLIDNEDKKKPLSDQAIADALNSMGLGVARRTVAKYRETELKILPARFRKSV